jgi:Double-GTPase 2
MATPALKLTMLGGTNSGKTMFMLGMYNTLAVGMHGYFMFTEDPDQDLDLREEWDALLSDGTLPAATVMQASRQFGFVFNHGFTPLVSIDWMDYRGGAVDARKDEADVPVLLQRLADSDSIYLVLDGQKLAPWLNGSASLDEVKGALKVGRVSALVHRAVSQRVKNDLPVPSFAVVITKADLLRGPGRTLRVALDRVVNEALRELAPLAFDEEISAFVCPVKVGNFGVRQNDSAPVSVSDVDPVGLHRPMIFSLMHYLTEGMGARRAEQARQAASISATERQLVELNQGFRAIFRSGRIAAAQRRVIDLDQALERNRQEYAANQSLIERLTEELAGHPMIRNGKVER